MAASDVKLLGKGIELYRGDGASPEVFTKVENVSEFPEAPSSLRDLVEDTDHDSPGTDKEYLLGLGDGNQIATVINWRNTSQQNRLLTDKNNGTERNFRLDFPMFSPTVSLSFTALVRGWDPIPNINGPLQIRVTLKVTGSVTPTGLTA